jgi:hypothetical protein
MFQKGICYFFITVFLIATMAGCTASNSDLDLSKLENGGQFSFPGLRPGASLQEVEEVLGFPLGEAIEETGPAPVYGKDNATLLYFFPKETPFTVLGKKVSTDYTFMEDTLCTMTIGMDFDVDHPEEKEKLISKLMELYGEPDINYTEDKPWQDSTMTVTNIRWIRESEGYYTVLACGILDLTSSGRSSYSVSLNLLYNEWTDVSELLSEYEEKLEELERKDAK